MKFRTYIDKSSIRKRNSRYIQGGVTEVNGNSVGWWERQSIAKNDVTDIEYTINDTYSGNEDLIGYDMYGRNDLGWLVLQYNNIVDINLELAVGKKIRLPSKERVFFELLSAPSSGRIVR